MNKLLFIIIIFLVGFSSFAEAQNDNNNSTSKLSLNKNSKHFTNTSKIDTLIVHKPLNKYSRNGINAYSSLLQENKIPEKAETNNTTQYHSTSIKKALLKSKLPKKKYVLIMKYEDTLKVREKTLLENN